MIPILLLLVACSTREEEWISRHLGEIEIVKTWGSNPVEEVSKAVLVNNKGHEKVIQFTDIQGFHDVIDLGVIINLDFEIIEKVVVIEEDETEDYGGLIKEDWFLGRYNDRSIKEPLETVVMMDKNDNEIVAVTGATISSTAVTDAVNLCIENVKELKLLGGDDVNE